jgi:Anti-sigma-K factor rskA
LSREPNLDELIDAEMTDAERQRLQHVHDLLLEAGPPPELTPQLRKAPTFGVVPLKLKRRAVKRRALVLLAAALAIAAVFIGGYAVANQQGGGKSASTALERLVLKGTSRAPGAHATLDVWRPVDGNWPMTLRVAGLHKLPPRTYYEVYLVRGGRIVGSCGTFRVEGSHSVTLTLNAPYPLEQGDSWVVTRQGAGGAEPGTPVLRPVAA